MFFPHLFYLECKVTVKEEDSEENVCKKYIRLGCVESKCRYISQEEQFEKDEAKKYEQIKWKENISRVQALTLCNTKLT